MREINEFSPMMRQYLDIKKDNKDGILFFRLGDFYEMFFEDAVIVSELLNLTLTSKSCGVKERVPMCGVPYHSAKGYISRLLKHGHKIVICEQIENDDNQNGIFKREVTRVITSGTITEEEMLNKNENNFLCSMVCVGNSVSVCFCDISTGVVRIPIFNEIKTNDFLKEIENELKLVMPSEIVISGNFGEKFKKVLKKICVFEEYEIKSNFNDTKNDIIKIFKLENEENINKITKSILDIEALGLMISYLKKINRQSIFQLKKIEIYNPNDYLTYECGALKNLEIFKNIESNNSKGSLLSIIDKTITPMGKRLLKNWIKRPLRNINNIKIRNDAVEDLFSDFLIIDELDIILKGVCDIERVMTKITVNSLVPRDLRMVMSSIKNFLLIKSLLINKKSYLLSEIHKNIFDLKDIYDLIKNSINEDAPNSLKDGSVIKKGFNTFLDQLYLDLENSENLISKIENEERIKTGIPKLKISYNRIFGYFIEVSDFYKNKVPEYYIRKQTLSGKERYITENLKEFEINILNAREKAIKLENEIFEEIKNKVYEHVFEINKSANAVACLDVIRSFAKVSINNNYNKPIVLDSNSIYIKNGRHPVIENLIKTQHCFIPNDCLIDDNQKILVITGPNMAGKSTYMRMIGLIVIMAQIGCFVPADSAQIGIVSRIYTRIGASDNLSEGKSTFMVEMSETAYITKNADKKSLLLIDEIGRGTSSQSGLSIAKATLEYISKMDVRTLFSTHYHELCGIDKYINNIKNYYTEVKKDGDDIIFLRKIIPGNSNKSFGIEIAKLAGLPEEIIINAKNNLKKLI